MVYLSSKYKDERKVRHSKETTNKSALDPRAKSTNNEAFEAYTEPPKLATVSMTMLPTWQQTQPTPHACMPKKHIKPRKKD